MEVIIALWFFKFDMNSLELNLILKISYFWLSQLSKKLITARMFLVWLVKEKVELISLVFGP